MPPEVCTHTPDGLANKAGEAAVVMRRLDFVLPDFARVTWVSDRARKVWEPRISSITKACMEIEWRSVASRIRACWITMASPTELTARADEWAQHGLFALPVEGGQIPPKPPTQNNSVLADLRDPIASRIVLGMYPDVASFKVAWDKVDHR